MVAAQVVPGSRVLIVRGADTVGSEPVGQGSGREWFAKRVAQAGAQADFVVAYQRCAPDFNAAEATLARQAAAQGQYEFPRGILYGGRDFEPQIRDLAAAIGPALRGYPLVMNIDLHTGYGARGVLHWMVSPNTVARDEDEMENVTSDITRVVEAAIQVVGLCVDSMESVSP